MANTEFSYMYRDASNWKQFETVILAGEVSAEDIDLIISKLEDGDLFIPEQVGLPALQGRWEKLNIDDHVWHELKRDDIKSTDIPPNLTMTAAQLVANFHKVDWDISRAEWLLWLDAEVDESARFDEDGNKL